MVDYATFEQLQEERARLATQSIQETAVFQCLYILDREQSPLRLTYAQKLARLAQLIARELATLEGSSDGTL